jgi:hypothetical protein
MDNCVGFKRFHPLRLFVNTAIYAQVSQLVSSSVLCSLGCSKESIQVENSLKSEYLLNIIQEITWCLTVNTLRFLYKHNQLIILRETNAIYCEGLTKHRGTLSGRNAEF